MNIIRYSNFVVPNHSFFCDVFVDLLCKLLKGKPRHFIVKDCMLYSAVNVTDWHLFASSIDMKVQRRESWLNVSEQLC